MRYKQVVKREDFSLAQTAWLLPRDINDLSQPALLRACERVRKKKN